MTVTKTLARVPTRGPYANQTLIEAIATANRWQEQIDSGEYAGTEELAKALGADRTYTLLDKLAAEVVSPGAGSAARYGYFFFLLYWAAYVALNRICGVRGATNRPSTWHAPLLAAVLNFGAYW